MNFPVLTLVVWQGWYASAYLLTTTALQPMYGGVYKLFNIKLIYLSAVLIFELGSLVSAVAPTSTAFIIGRAIAGVSSLWLASILLSPSDGRALEVSR